MELLLPTGDFRLLEVRRNLVGGLPKVHGIALVAGGVSYHLNGEAGFRGFLRALAGRPDPLSLALLFVRYRAPEILGEWPVELITRADQLHPLLAESAAEVELIVSSDAIEFTTQLESPTEAGSMLLGLDRWRVSLGGTGIHVEGERLARRTVAAR
ncbi:MAG TPA: hypothetical protein VK919_00100 [Solirubrobacterales bacterium]|nr:hypothetical protein [Solirubrobacterales bacterium]